MQARSGGGSEGGEASRRLERILTIGLGLGHGWTLAAAVNLFCCAPVSTFLFIALRDGARQPGERLGAPDLGMDQGPNWPFGQLVEINLTFSSLISSYDLNLTYFIFFPFHHRSVHRACLIITVNCH